jgi:hypothetical protein
MTAFFTILSAAVTLVVLTASAATTLGTSVHFRFYQSRLLQKIEQLPLFRAIILYRFLRSFCLLLFAGDFSIAALKLSLNSKFCSSPLWICLLILSSSFTILAHLQNLFFWALHLL